MGHNGPMSTRIHVVVDEALLKRVDGLRGDVPRSKFIARILENATTPPEGAQSVVGGPDGRQYWAKDEPLPLDPSQRSVRPSQKSAPAIRDTWAR